MKKQKAFYLHGYCCSFFNLNKNFFYIFMTKWKHFHKKYTTTQMSLRSVSKIFISSYKCMYFASFNLLKQNMCLGVSVSSSSLKCQNQISDLLKLSRTMTKYSSLIFQRNVKITCVLNSFKVRVQPRMSRQIYS